MALTLDSSIGLFAPFAAACPTSVQQSLDSATLLNAAMSNDRWTENWTHGGKRDK